MYVYHIGARAAFQANSINDQCCAQSIVIFPVIGQLLDSWLQL